ncbi:E3 ubiquitin-protein ligase ATL6 [Linum grandiflorum]
MATAAAAFCLLSLLLLSLRPPPFAAAQQPPPPNQVRDPFAYTRVTPSMAVIIIVLMIALFVLGFFSIYVRRRAIAAAVGGGSIRNLGRSHRGAAAAPRGLDQAVIETFPTMIYSAVKGMKIGKEDLECAVCLNEFDDDETLRLIPICDHVFHPECIDAWLEAHTTCPVCRANLTLQPGDSALPSQLASELGLMTSAATTTTQSDLEAGPPNDAVLDRVGDCGRQTGTDEAADRVFNRSRTSGSRSGRPRKFPRSHSTGHSLVQPGENTDRFTLKLPADVRKRLVANRELNRTMSLIALPRESSTRRGYRMGDGLGSNSGKYSKYKRLEPLETESKSNRWKFNRTASFLTRASSFLTRASSSVRSPRVVVRNNEDGPSSRPVGQDNIQSVRPPV